jgi:hypothetical protein
MRRSVHESKKCGRAYDSPAGSYRPNPYKQGSVYVIIQKRGGAGTYRQVSPDPHTTHNPKPKVQGVC